jgi:uncharacterized protein (UPF0332 family)
LSPRSEEFMASANERLRAARAALAAGFPSVAVSAVYYAALYAARAALSEEERHAKTHRGTWNLFAETFVSSGRFDPELLAAARRIQDVREASDYDAREVSSEEAGAIIADAEAFVAGVAEILGA